MGKDSNGAYLMPPPFPANHRKPLKGHYLSVFITRAVSGTTDEMQVHLHAGHKGNYTTLMTLMDSRLEIVCVWAPLANILHRIIFYLNDHPGSFISDQFVLRHLIKCHYFQWFLFLFFNFSVPYVCPFLISADRGWPCVWGEQFCIHLEWN